MRIQGFIQELLDEEITELLGRAKSAWITPAVEEKEGDGVTTGARQGYRNGHGKPRNLSTRCGTITVRRPRVRNLEEPFVRRVLPLFRRHTEEVGEMLPRLYLHGLS